MFGQVTSSVPVTIQFYFPEGIFRKIKSLGRFNFISSRSVVKDLFRHPAQEFEILKEKVRKQHCPF
jgi:hypothetical protein